MLFFIKRLLTVNVRSVTKMKSEKHLQKKKEIINTAFTVWNRNCYFSTSLNDIAESLAITKQAIYRYFSSKKDLLNAMEQQIINDYRQNSNLLIKKIETLSTEKAVEFYIMNQISFFRKHHEYITFLVSRIRLKDHQDKEFLYIEQEQSDYLKAKLSLPYSAVNYLTNLIVFYSLMGVKESSEKLTGRIVIIFRDGFGTELLKPSESFDQILKNTRLTEYEDSEKDKVFQAISDTVLEKGLQASLGQIAQKAGMTKSSLYFYFKNKEDMIMKTMNRQIEKFVDYYYSTLSSFKNIGDQLFAHFVITASMTIELPKTIPMIHWFITRGMAESFVKPTDYEKYRVFFEKAISHRYLNTHGIQGDKLLMLINFCITYEINNIQRNNLNKEEKYDLVYGLYNLFIYGLRGSEKEKTGDAQHL